MSETLNKVSAAAAPTQTGKVVGAVSDSTRTLKSPSGTMLYLRTWLSASQSTAPRGLVLLLHGFGEHIGRYDEVARRLVAAGFVVYGPDLRGHGHSGGPRGYCSSFSDYLADAKFILETARQDGISAPLYLVAHSFGGLVATAFTLANPDLVSALALSSPWYENRVHLPAWKRLSAGLLSRVAPQLSIATEIPPSDVSRNPETQKNYATDPLVLKGGTPRWFVEAQAAQARVIDQASKIVCPALFLVAGADRLADADVTQKVFASLGTAAADKKLVVYPNQFHELFFEPLEDRNVTLTTLVDWLVGRTT